MRVALTGATGLIGTAVVRTLRERGDELIALTRNPDNARRTLGEGVEIHPWQDPMRDPPPPESLRGADAVVNLAGEPIAQRWSTSTKQAIRDSRVLGTRTLVKTIAALDERDRPRVLVSQSAVGYYGPRSDEPVTESSEPGDDFLAHVVRDWEAAAANAPAGVRVVLTRTGVVLSPHGGALAQMLPPFKLGVGGPVAGGRQYVPWIHLDDVAGAIVDCIGDDRASGPVNLTAPTPVTNRELSRTLGRVLGRPALLPVPGIALKLLYGEMASVVLTGQRAVPAMLEQLGYSFRFPELEPALRAALGR